MCLFGLSPIEYHVMRQIASENGDFLRKPVEYLHQSGLEISVLFPVFQKEENIYN